MARLYLMDIREAALLPEEYCAAHFPKRMERAQKFIRREDRLRCVGAGALLSGILGLDEHMIRLGAYGKPFAPDVYFNLSHSGDFILLAADTAEIGADIERASAEHLNIASHVFQAEELRWMRSGNEIVRFHRLWTLKESMMKQNGLGLGLEPLSFSVLPLILRGSMPFRERALYAASECTDGHVLSVCSANPLENATPQRVFLQDIVHI